jgi:hypothetical protein
MDKFKALKAELKEGLNYKIQFKISSEYSNLKNL